MFNFYKCYDIMILTILEGNMFLYNVLGVDKKSSLQDVKNAYRNLAKKYHPDLNEDEGTEIVFKTIKIAYEILSNDYTRSKYDNAIMQVDSIYASDFLTNFEKEVKNAYLQDLSLSMEFNRKIVSNLDYFIANTINSLTIGRGIAPNEIEKTIKKAYAKYEQMATKDTRSEVKKEVRFEDTTPEIPKDLKKRKSNFSVFLIIGVVVLIISIAALANNPQAQAEFKRKEELRQQEIKAEQQAIERERLKQERVAKARLNPDLYWKFTFASPDKDNTFVAKYAVDYSDRVNKNMYCVVVGVTATKNTGSVYYLDDSYDNGSISLALDDFKIGSTKATSFVKYDCDYIKRMYPITTSWSFLMTKGETVYLLFEIYTKVVNDSEQFKYKNTLITDLNFK
jgi:curved DNA-binding protein CbpA